MMIKGVDISRAQLAFDFDKAIKDGVKFVIIRAGIRSGMDTYFKRNVRECEKRDIPYGFYWFFEAVTDSEFDKELSACENTVRDYRPKYPVFFDMETQQQIEKLTTRKRTDMAKKFCRRMNEIGLPSGIYANPAWMESYYYKNELIGNYDIWLAHWTENPNRPSKYDYGQTMWQWGIDYIEGVGDVDGDVCFIDYPEKTAMFYKQNGKPEKPAEPEKPDNSLKVGDRVRVKKGARFADGTKPFDFVYNTVYTVQQISRDKMQALIGIDGQLTGWMLTADLIPEKEEEQEVLRIGDKVKVKEGASAYNGAPLASFVYKEIYTVIQVGIRDNPDYIVIGQNGAVTAAVRRVDLTKE